MDRATLRKEFLTLRGHVVMLGAPFAAILIPIELHDAHVGRWLTWAFAFRTVAGEDFCGALVGAIVWYTATRPYLKRTKQ